jgi:hypothetical protein
VAQQISYLYSISVHTLLSKLRITVATKYLVLPESSGKVVANGGMYTVSSTSHAAQSPVFEHTDTTRVSLFCAVTSVSSS